MQKVLKEDHHEPLYKSTTWTRHMVNFEKKLKSPAGSELGIIHYWRRLPVCFCFFYIT